MSQSSDDKPASLWPLALVVIALSWFTHQIEAIQEDDKRRNTHSGGENQHPPISNVMPPPPEPQKTKTTSRPDQTPWWKTFGEGIAVFGGIGLLIVNIYQMKATDRSARAAESAATTASNTFKLTYRARVKIVGIGPNQVSDGKRTHVVLDHGKITVQAGVLNAGPFTARNVQWFRYSTIVPRGHLVRQNYRAAMLNLPSTIEPKSEGGNCCPNMTIAAESAASKSDLASLERGDMEGSFSLLITYDDDLGETHHAEYCDEFTLHPSDFQAPCPWPVRND